MARHLGHILRPRDGGRSTTQGQLLHPGSREELDAQPDRYRDVVAEISRRIDRVSGLAASPSPVPGWVRGRVRLFVAKRDDRVQPRCAARWDVAGHARSEQQ